MWDRIIIFFGLILLWWPDDSMTSTVVYVIGGGLAGMSAAWAALKSGASVVLVDKQTLGGNSAKATSGVNAVNTRYQSVMENDSVELFLEDTYASGHSKCVRSLAEVLVAHSGRVVDALETEFNLSLPNIERLGGHSAKRTHRFQTVDNRVAPFGHIVCSTIRDRLKLIANGEKPLEDFGTLEIWENTSLVNFSISEDFHGSRIIENLEFHNSEGSNVIRNPSAVVFTAGGYAADTTSNSIIATVRKDLIGFPTTNGDFSTGDLVQLGIQKGLLTESLDQVQLHPTGFVHPMKPLEHRKFLCPEVVRGLGAILLNIDGHRFIDELAPRDTVSAGILKFGSLASDWNLTTDEGGQQKIALLLLSEEMSTNFGKPAFDFYRKIGLIFDLPDEQAFQSKLPVINYRNLLETLEMYDKFDPQSNPDPLGKAVIPLKFGAQPTLYGAYVTPALHYTMGGLAVSCDSRALIRDENKGVLPILNLFVAGENAGGVHGNNRLGGNGCLESLVFGRLSGRFSAKVRGCGFQTFILNRLREVCRKKRTN